jgi:phosphinothricin acetyltransferase
MTIALQSPPVTIDSCEERHLAEITAIYAEAVIHGTASFELDPPSLADMAARWQALSTAGFPYLVSEIDGRVTGYAYAGAYRARPAYRSTVESSVYIQTGQRGRGIGRHLMLALIDRCETLGFRQLIANVGDSANVASLRLHQSVGFEIAGTLISVGWKHGRWLDTVLMQRPLGAGDALLGDAR